MTIQREEDVDPTNRLDHLNDEVVSVIDN
jgi:hypothetical protein